MKKERKAFSLIELMIVLVIIGAFVSIILTNFGTSQQTTREQSVQVEMYNIRKAFVKYYHDNFPSLEEEGAFHFVARFGVAVLCEQSVTAYDYTGDDEDLYEAAFADRDMKNNLGWRGAYITHEGRETVSVEAFGSTNAATHWQESATTGTSIPVIKDPYGGYYRIVIPKEKNSDVYLPQYAFIVCTGANKTLQTFSSDFEDDEDSENYLQILPTYDSGSTTNVGGEAYDDEVLMIFPEFIN